MNVRLSAAAVSYALGMVAVSALGQSAAPQPVQWTVAVEPKKQVSAGEGITLHLAAPIDPGWHVYALNEPSGGPIPLRIALDNAEIAQIDGAISGTTPKTQHDESFQSDTSYYEGHFELRVPVKLARVHSGEQALPLSVRFQACSSRTCLPPRTVHLPVSVEVIPGA
ncbi:protein-disulfide reductase DsbD domain-containing protein [Silvibacterium sp.]|uniref:protein-disulfide reductase DsbD domain-containing protein n=1 Tax=Silvibacterium sp. TaxID=1964179 RepID=UPI0039E2E8EB